MAPKRKLPAVTYIAIYSKQQAMKTLKDQVNYLLLVDENECRDIVSLSLYTTLSLCAR